MAKLQVKMLSNVKRKKKELEIHITRKACLAAKTNLSVIKDESQ